MNGPLAPLGPVLAGGGLDAVAIIPGPNFRKLMGRDFHRMERPLVLIVPAAGAPAAVVPALEMSAFRPLGYPGEAIAWTDEAGYADAFARAAAVTGPLRRIGVEGQVMRVFEAQALARAYPGAELVDAQRAISAIRLCKGPAEVAALRAAIRLSETAFEATLAELRIGMSEREIAGLLTRNLLAAGSEGLAFAPIVAAGANAADPHAVPQPGRRIGRGDALLFDFGGMAGGFTADITRTVFVGEVGAEDRALYETVRAANAAGRAAAGPGVTAEAVDAAATAILAASPFRDCIRHKTGHGLGLDVHEDPHIMRGNPMPLRPGMVFTVEPGLYREGRLGVRIEDDVLVTEQGAESLTGLPRELRIVG
jgi:Xaa-Pro dipeptidase